MPWLEGVVVIYITERGGHTTQDVGDAVGIGD